jgi:hypothetical protein
MAPKIHVLFAHVVAAAIADNGINGRLSEEEFEAMHLEPKKPKGKDERLAVSDTFHFPPLLPINESCNQSSF